VGFCLLVAPQNRRCEESVRHASRSGSLLQRESSLANVFQSDLKISGDTMTGGACDIIAEVALKEI
jgi:hypothetical protein